MLLMSACLARPLPFKEESRGADETREVPYEDPGDFPLLCRDRALIGMACDLACLVVRVLPLSLWGSRVMFPKALRSGEATVRTGGEIEWGGLSWSRVFESRVVPTCICCNYV
jgi:hypothetical protein